MLLQWKKRENGKTVTHGECSINEAPGFVHHFGWDAQMMYPIKKFGRNILNFFLSRDFCYPSPMKKMC